jgi:AcrR family transcriptional regulator
MPTRKARRVYAGQTHDARVSERRRAFIEAGLSIIGTQGYRAATVRAVCAEAGLTDRYFYESFGTTEALLQAVYSEIGERLHAAIDDAIAKAPSSLEAQLDAALSAFLDTVRDPRAARILFAEVLGVSSAITALYLKTTSEFAEQLLDAVKLHVPEFEKHPEDRRVLGLALIGAMTFAASAWALSGYTRPATHVVRNCRRILIGTVRQFAEEASAVPARSASKKPRS